MNSYREASVTVYTIFWCSAALTDNTILAQSILFILAGYDTTANTLSFVSHCLAKHQDYQDLLRTQLQEKCRNSPDGELTYQDIMEMPYLDAVIAGKPLPSQASGLPGSTSHATSRDVS